MTRMTDEKTESLPAEPDTWGDAGGFQQRWMPGAFGDRTNIADVDKFQVVESEWDAEFNRRTILKATIVSLL